MFVDGDVSRSGLGLHARTCNCSYISRQLSGRRRPTTRGTSERGVFRARHALSTNDPLHSRCWAWEWAQDAASFPPGSINSLRGPRTKQERCFTHPAPEPSRQAGFAARGVKEGPNSEWSFYSRPCAVRYLWQRRQTVFLGRFRHSSDIPR